MTLTQHDRLSRRNLVAAGLAIPGLLYLGEQVVFANRISKAEFHEEVGFFEEIQEHENEHVAFLVSALGAQARPKPHFKNLNQTQISAFAQLSATFENTGVGAYLGAASAITDASVLLQAATIATVEARHAGWVNSIVGKPLTPNNAAFDSPLTAQQVATAVAPYVKDLNGGPALTYTPGDTVSILNFALALEYLEAEFYNLNVPNLTRKHA